MIGPNTPGTLVVLAGSGLLLASSLSAPIFKTIYFISADVQVTVSNVNLTGNIILGVFGFCVQLGQQFACSSPKLGYTLAPESLVSLPANTNFGAHTWILRALTYILILHPIAAALAFLAAISGVISHIREYSRTCYTSCLASLAAAVGLLAFVFDIVAFSIAKSRINSASTTNAQTSAHLGIAIWITLAGWACLAFSGCFFCAGRCLLRRRHRDQLKADAIRPINDEDFASHMRAHAAEAEKARENASANGKTLPAFTEWKSEQVQQEHIPLNRFDPPDEERYSDHHHLVSPDRRMDDQEAVQGVGVGYGRRDELRHIPSTSARSVYSQASHHPSARQPPPLPPLGFMSRQQSQGGTGDPYSNLPAHVTPASATMNPPRRASGTRHPSSLTPSSTTPHQTHRTEYFPPYPPPDSMPTLAYPNYERKMTRSPPPASLQPGQTIPFHQPNRGDSYGPGGAFPGFPTPQPQYLQADPPQSPHSEYDPRSVHTFGSVGTPTGPLAHNNEPYGDPNQYYSSRQTSVADMRSSQGPSTGQTVEAGYQLSRMGSLGNGLDGWHGPDGAQRGVLDGHTYYDEPAPMPTAGGPARSYSFGGGGDEEVYGGIGAAAAEQANDGRMPRPSGPRPAREPRRGLGQTNDGPSMPPPVYL